MTVAEMLQLARRLDVPPADAEWEALELGRDFARAVIELLEMPSFWRQNDFDEPLTEEQERSIALGLLDIEGGNVAPWSPDDGNRIRQHFALISLGRNLHTVAGLAWAFELGERWNAECWWPGCGREAPGNFA